MNTVLYGDKKIEYQIQLNPKLKAHYISVEKGKGVILKGRQISKEKADSYILKKAKWILKKQELVKEIEYGDIVTGSRLYYLGKKYYTEVCQKFDISEAKIEFNYSKFKIYVNPEWKDIQAQIKKALDIFYKIKAKEKIIPRIIKLAQDTGLSYNTIKFLQMDKRWGSCTPTNNIIINIEAVKLSFQSIDYLIIHELCHTKIKKHSKEFWALVYKHLPNYKVLDEKMGLMKL